MSDSMIQLSPDSTGKKVDTEELTIGANSVHRERMQIAGDSATDIAPVTAADGLLVNLGTNNDVTVAGGATLAEQQTQSTALAAIETAVELLDNAVAGNELQVDVVAALPAGTNNIGDVDIASLPNEGQQNMAGSISVAIASDQSAVPVSGTVAVTGSSTLAEQQTQTTHLAAIETAVEIIDNAIAGSEMQVDIVAALPAGNNNIGDVDIASSVLPTGASTLAEQQAQTTVLGTIDADTGGILTSVQLLDNAIAGSEMQVDVVAALPAGTNNIGDVDVLTLPALVAGTANIGDVDIASAPTGASSISVQGTAAHAAAAVGNPVYIGGRASNAVPTDVGADADVAAMWMNRNGAPVVSMAPHVGLGGSPWTLTGETAQYTTTQTSAVLVAGGVSERLVVTKVQIQVGGTTAGTMQLYFGTGAYTRGTTLAIFDGEFAPSATLKPGVVMDGPFISAANGDDLLVTTSAAINPLTVTVWYYVLT